MPFLDCSADFFFSWYIKISPYEFFTLTSININSPHPCVCIMYVLLVSWMPYTLLLMTGWQPTSQPCCLQPYRPQSGDLHWLWSRKRAFLLQPWEKTGTNHSPFCLRVIGYFFHKYLWNLTQSSFLFLLQIIKKIAMPHWVSCLSLSYKSELIAVGSQGKVCSISVMFPFIIQWINKIQDV